MSFEKKVFWSPVRPSIPGSNQTTKSIRHQTFLPTYVQEEPQMCLILSWHYGRQWLEERQAHENTIKRRTREIKKFIPPNFDKWLESRKTNLTRRQRALRVS
ncbi:hypothetical protein KR032_005940 [Drosophila birchii]|nr:hypothetical protein KR032_005940 [Drosophila birchii]